jgi:hypothetical protein
MPVTGIFCGGMDIRTEVREAAPSDGVSETPGRSDHTSRRSQTMPRFMTFLLGVAAGVMLYHTATIYHVVQAQDGFHFVKKSRARLAEAYVDVRSFGVNEWASHAELAADLTAANKSHVVTGSTANAIQSGLSQLPNWGQQQ